MNLTVTSVSNWLTNFAQLIEKNKQYLSQLDTPIGDGDHGYNMARGMQEVITQLKTKQPDNVTDCFKITAMSLISKVGGASGPLYGTAFLEMAKASNQTTDLNELLQSALAGIKKRGGAQANDKTLVDVWEVVLPRLAKNQLQLADITTAVEQTKDMIAKKGRASYLGQRSSGHLDPGAVSSGYLFEALLNTKEIWQ